MQYSGKPPRLSGKLKNHNNQMPSPYNGGLHFLSTPPNVSNSGQLQVNRKYINNMGNINEIPVLQYHRNNSMQIKSNNVEMNSYQNLRHQQQQPAFVYKTPQYHNHMNPNLQQKFTVNYSNPRKYVKEQAIPSTAALLQPRRIVEFNSKKSKELQNQQEAHKLNNKNNSQEQPDVLKEKESSSKTILLRHKQVPGNDHETVEIMESNKENNKMDIQSGHLSNNNNREQSEALNINNEQTENQFEDTSDKSTKIAREKTPMCLINDLARFNKISFQYRLTSENGPAHCKRFTVTLMLGDEEYTAEGLKIKEAQHLAAKEAIEKTKYKHPTPKTNRRIDDDAVKPNITPTVELNALAMKLGQRTYYIFDQQQTENVTNCETMNQPFETTQALPLQQQQTAGVIESLTNTGRQLRTLNQRRQYLSRYQNRYAPFQHSQQNGATHQFYKYFPPSSPCKITLLVGTKQFIGVGKTLQLAKHDAASNALKVLKEQLEKVQLETQNDTTEENDNKSPISLVFEIGIKRSLPVDFKVLREEGPAHMRTFVTACIVGDIVTEGEGTGKKISKKKAACKMLEELKKLPPLTPVASPVKRTKLKTIGKKNYEQSHQHENSGEAKQDAEKPSCYKSKKATAETEATNPINKFIEWHQNKKEKEPEFKLVSESGKENTRRRQFVMEVYSNNIIARGIGSSKRLAKQDAAQKFLNAVADNNEEPVKAAASNSATEITTKDAKQTVEQTSSKVEHNTTLHKQVENNNNLPTNKEASREPEINGTALITSSTSLKTVSASKETTGSTNTSTRTQNLHMKDQLMYLAKLLGFDVEFSDYPKGNHNEFLTIVMLSTTPPQICHGVGVNAEESQEDAAKNALKILSEMGLNNAVKS